MADSDVPVDDGFVRETFQAMVETRQRRDDAIAEFQGLRQKLAKYELDVGMERVNLQNLVGPDLRASIDGVGSRRL